MHISDLNVSSLKPFRPLLIIPNVHSKLALKGKDYWLKFE
jgi:hypothetical protein